MSNCTTQKKKLPFKWRCDLIDEVMTVAGVFFTIGLGWQVYTQNEHIHELMQVNNEMVKEYSAHIADLNAEIARSAALDKDRTERIATLQLTLESMQNSINALTMTIDDQQARIQKLLKGKK